MILEEAERSLLPRETNQGSPESAHTNFGDSERGKRAPDVIDTTATVQTENLQLTGSGRELGHGVGFKISS